MQGMRSGGAVMRIMQDCSRGGGVKGKARLGHNAGGSREEHTREGGIPGNDVPRAFAAAQQLLPINAHGLEGGSGRGGGGALSGLNL